jgi:RHS repeat-associated protein
VSNLRVTTNLGTTTTYFVGNHYEVTGGVVTKYYYAGSQRIAMRDNGTLFFLLGDHLGSTSLVTFGNGNVVSETRYKAWGEVRYASGTTPTDYTYTGQMSYTERFGLMFYNARWYDPYITQFSQPDSIIPDPYNPQDWNRYAYARNNPVRYTDPTGHCPEEDAACRKNLAILLRKPIFHSFDGGWNDPRFSTWNLLRQGSACTACHVTHDQPGDWGVPTNDELSLIQVQGWRSLDQYTIPVHLGGVGITTFYASEAIAAAEEAPQIYINGMEGGDPAAHAWSKHGPNASDDFLRQQSLRYKSPQTKFTDADEMADAVSSTLSANMTEIESMAASGEVVGNVPFSGPGGVGYTGYHQGSAIGGQSTSTTIVINFNTSGGWTLRTAYPVP